MKNILWGMPTLIELDKIEGNVALCNNLGLDFVELNMNLPQYQPQNIDIEELNYLKEKYSVFFTIHMPEDLDVFHFNDTIRAANHDLLVQTIDIAEMLNVPLINLHMNVGIYFTLPTERIYLYERYNDDFMNNVNSFCDKFASKIKENNIKLLIENTGIYQSTYITNAIDKLLELDNVGLTWDIGHDHKSKDSDKGYIERHIQRVNHMHIHDSINGKDHLPLYDGEINITDKLKLAEDNSCTCVIETKSVAALRVSVERLKLKDMLL